ncbi:hypothetical protein [Streptomyces sp. NPDC101181]|uniref:hypothetical protein n=1 Tax=Streptomyces sp. NPDC101181 TaxID=3366125 RepID=UPI00381924A9
MLQCTALTELPEMGMRVALLVLEDEPGQEEGAKLALDDFLLCELGEHDKDTEHAAQLWAADRPAARDLWMFWTDTATDTEMRRKFRFAELLPCPAVIHRLSVTEGDVCVLYDRHPGAHSWDVTDPLAELMAEQIRQDILREREGQDGSAAGDGHDGRDGPDGPDEPGGRDKPGEPGGPSGGSDGQGGSDGPPGGSDGRGGSDGPPGGQGG